MIPPRPRPYAQYQRLPHDWLETLPAEWEVRRLKFCARLINAKGEDAEQSFYVGLENVESATGKYLVSEVSGEPESVVNSFVAGDVLFGKLRPYLAKAWKADKAGVCSTEFFVLREKEYCAEFLRWLCLSPGFVAKVDGSTFGSKMPRASWDDVGELATPLPSLNEQRAIAAYLDQETSRIDGLIEKKRRLVELLKEKRAAMITEVISRGTDRVVPLRDSYLPSLGMIPRHWKVKRLKHVSPRLMVGIVVNPSTFVSESGKPFLVGSNVKEGRIAWNEAAKIDDSGNLANLKSILRKGDLVTVRVGAPGVTAVVPDEVDGGNAASVMIMRGDKSFDSQWLCHVMNSRIVRSQIEVVQYGAAQEQFNISHAVDFWVPVPTLDEQRAIAAYLDAKVGQIEGLVFRLNGTVRSLQEYRSALVAAAVTGQIDVRKAE